MSNGIFENRERAIEAAYFRQQDSRLIDDLRRNAALEEIAAGLVEKLHVDNPRLLARARRMGITADTAAALLLAPLVQVAWAAGTVGNAEYHAVLRIARKRGVDSETAAYLQLREWLTHRPPPAIFETALEVLKIGLSVLPRAEREQRIEQLANACRQVALAPKGLAMLFDIGRAVYRREMSMAAAIDAELRKAVPAAQW